MRKDEEDLTSPPEPEDIKKEILGLRSRTGSEMDIDWDSLAVWYGNRIPKYLWTECGWKNILSKKGYTWQRFLKLMKYHTTDMVLWVRGWISWEEFVQRLMESVKRGL